ncbi:rhomboid family intramembrane serine protease [Lusitaniella coriacea LEGE 07157]|uniref:Rhomboid family intramembrane serine protease n=1 Tax=Lusitaniella coriacea LEGE 07157 TaxID=945747 RepID=A0A8J7ISY1_9CYAN|nr:rhomboid family intramembrane serine protease [Lusitaniella coriacea]MBE9115513.1 rhomboid family intramembrane serine protease [Lusitaniella coriacea LEGE 07157]
MNLDTFLIWTVCLSCVSIFLRATPSPSYRGWTLVSGGILAIVALLVYFVPEWAAIVGGGLWGILVLVPLIGFAQVNRLINQQQYAKASRISAYLRWLHPADGWLEHPPILRALERAWQGHREEAWQYLQHYNAETKPIGRHAIAIFYAMDARWQDLQDWIEESIPQRVLKQELNLLLYYLRSLGETGQINELLHRIQQYERILDKGDRSNSLHLVRMFAFAFCGQVDEVVRLFKRALSSYDRAYQDFWCLTALMAAGQERTARQKLIKLAQENNGLLESAISWRLAHPPPFAARILNNASQTFLFQMRDTWGQDIRYGRVFSLKPQKARITYSLIGINLIFFALEIYLGGSENLEILYSLGALIPEAAWDGEWWRFILANFLHFGYIHLIANMFALYLFGPFVELNLGIWRYLCVYGISGIGTMVGFAFWVERFGDPDTILVGASAAIMGAIGATAAILLRGWRLDRSRMALKRLRLILLIILSQTAFDFVIPQVSFFAHTSGLVLGFGVGWAVSYSNSH